jgi:phosphopantetheine adenylyltransferase
MRHVLHSETGQVKEKEESDVILEEKETELRSGELRRTRHSRGQD